MCFFIGSFWSFCSLFQGAKAYDYWFNNVDYHKKSGTLNLEFTNLPGVFEFGHLETTRLWIEGIDIYFEHGCLQLKLPPAFMRNYPATVVLEKDKPEKSIKTISSKHDWTWSFMKQAESFVEVVLSGSKSIASADNGLLDIEFIENVWKKIV